MSSLFSIFYPSSPKVPDIIIVRNNDDGINSNRQVNADNEIESLAARTLKSENYSGSKKDLTSRLANLHPSQIDHLLNWVGTTSHTEEKRPFEYLERLMSLLTPEQIEAALQQRHEGNFEAIDQAQRQIEQALFWLKTAEKPPSPSLIYACAAYLMNVIQMTIEAGIMFTGVDRFLVKPNDPLAFQGAQFFTYMGIFLGLESGLRSLFEPTLDEIQRGIVPNLTILNNIRLITVACMIVVGIATILYQKYLKREDTHIEGFQNLTLLTRQEGLHGNKHAKEHVQNLIGSVSANEEHTLFIGSPGAGKPTAQELAYFLANDERTDGKNKKVYYIDTGIFNNPAGVQKLEQIINALGNDRKNFVFAFEYFHLIYHPVDGRPESGLANYLNRLVSDKENSPHIIGITDYQCYSYFTPPLGWQYNTVSMGEPSRESVLSELTETLIREAPELTVEDDILTYLYDKTRDAFSSSYPPVQPDIFSSVLSQAIKAVKTLPFSKKSEKIKSLEGEKAKTIAENARRRKNITDTNELDKDIRKKTAKLNKQKARFTALYESQNQMVAAKHRLDELTVKVAAIEPAKKASYGPLIKEFLQAHELYRNWCSRVESLESGERSYRRLDKTIVDHVIKEQLDIQDKCRSKMSMPPMPGPHPSMSHNSRMHQSGTPQSGMYQDGMHQSGTYQNSTTSYGMPQSGMHHSMTSYGMPQAGMGPTQYSYMPPQQYQQYPQEVEREKGDSSEFGDLT